MELLCHALCRDDDDDEDDIAEVSGRPKEIDQQARVPTIMFVQTWYSCMFLMITAGIAFGK